MKFDGLRTTADNAATRALCGRRSNCGPFDPVLLAGSTGDPEEATVLDAFEQIRTHRAQLPPADRPAARGTIRRRGGADRGAGI